MSYGRGYSPNSATCSSASVSGALKAISSTTSPFDISCVISRRYERCIFLVVKRTDPLIEIVAIVSKPLKIKSLWPAVVAIGIVVE